MVATALGGDKRLLFLALASLGLYAAAARFVTGMEDTGLWLGLYAGQWVVYLALVGPERSSMRFLSPAAILGLAALYRLLLVATPIWLSDDLYRYLLDGQVLASGINPFRYAPEDPRILALLPRLAQLVNHPDVPTIYPPVVQLAGLLAAWLRLDVLGWRVMLSLVDVAALGVLARAHGGGRDGWRAAAVYGLCPLAVWEIGANGHTEALLLPCLAAAIWMSRRDAPIRTGLALALAALVKLFPLIFLPLWLRHRFVRVSAVALAAFCAGLWPFSWNGVDISAGLRTYLAHWSFNSPVHGVLHAMIGQEVPLRVLPFAAAGGLTLALGARGVRPREALPWVIFVFLMLGPTLHPWYALWLLPWLGARPHWGLWGFVGAMGLGYAVWWRVHADGTWQLPDFVRVPLWTLVALAFVAQARRPQSSVGKVGGLG